MASPGTVKSGQPVTLTVSVRSAQAFKGVVDVEVMGPGTGKQVFQKFWDTVSFAAGESKQFSVTFTSPSGAPGTYSVKVGVFAPSWASLKHWNNEAASIVVQ